MLPRIGWLARRLAVACALLAAAAPSAHALGNGLARTPPMGWNPWNRFGCAVDERLVRESADALLRSGMAAAGYRYVNVDDCWMARNRDAQTGALVADPVRFPHGMAALVSEMHERGLGFGLYISVGARTCAGYPGSLGHIGQDLRQFAAWGVDYLKVDWCWQPPGWHPRSTYAAVRNAISATHHRMVISISADGYEAPWSWGAAAGNLWRTTGDVHNDWRSIMRAVESESPLAGYAHPGAWNDLDMLQVGNGGLTHAEERASFSLWSMLASPLIAGNDIRYMSPQTRAILTNGDIIRVDQDPAARPATRLARGHGHETWLRPLAHGRWALLLLNRTRHRARLQVNLARLPGLPHRSRYSLRNLWTHRAHRSGHVLRATVGGHDVAIYALRPDFAHR